MGQLKPRPGKCISEFLRVLVVPLREKRAQNDVNKARKFAVEGIVGDLLPIKDSLEMGLAAETRTTSNRGRIGAL